MKSILKSYTETHEILKSIVFFKEEELCSFFFFKEHDGFQDFMVFCIGFHNGFHRISGFHWFYDFSRLGMDGRQDLDGEAYVAENTKLCFYSTDPNQTEHGSQA